MSSIKHRSTFSTIFITFLTSFLLGLLISLYFFDKIAIFEENGNVKIVKQSPEKDLDMTRFWEVYELIQEESYDISHIDKQLLVEGAIRGLVEGLDDKHSQYLDFKEKERFEESLSGDFEGIGAYVDKHPLGIKIERVMKGSPALKAGVKANDIVITSNSHILQDLNLYDAIDKIKGPAGTKANLEILREGENDILNITVIRDKIVIPSVESELLDGNIAYISLNMFGDDTSNEFTKALRSMKDSQGLIIDVRDNGGGYLYSAVDILSELLEDDTLLVVTKYAGLRKNDEYRSINFSDPYGKPIVVLINENSASASEIVAGALHDHKKGILVGKKTYGKGSVQIPYDVSGDALLKLTIAKWFTPLDKNIDKEGINADIEVDFEKQDFENQYDRQLEVAKKVLNDFIETNDFDTTVTKFQNEITQEEK